MFKILFISITVYKMGNVGIWQGSNHKKARAP